MLCRQTTFVRALMAQTHASQTRVRVVTGEVLDLCRVPPQDRSASLSRGCTSVLSMRGRDRAEGLRHSLRRPGRVCSSAAAFLAVCAALVADVLIPTGGPLIVNIDGDFVQVAPAMASHCARVRNEHAVLVCIGLSPRAQPRHPRVSELKSIKSKLGPLQIGIVAGSVGHGKYEHGPAGCGGANTYGLYTFVHLVTAPNHHAAHALHYVRMFGQCTLDRVA